MGAITQSELERRIKGGDISGAYYLYGTDFYDIQITEKSLVEKTVSKDDRDFNLHSFEGKDIDISALCDACECLPVFAEKLCVTVCDLDLETEKLPDKAMKQLTETIKNLPETTVLVFYTANADVCKGKKTPSAKNKKLIDAVSKSGTVCIFPTKTKSDAIREISRLCSKEGCTVDSAAADMLFERCCGDFLMIAGEVQKLCAYSAGKNITTETVNLLTPETPDAKGYELADAAAAGNISLSMKLLSELTAMRSDPVYLLYVVTGSMIDIYRARLALDSKHSVGDVMNDFGYAKNLEFRVKNAFKAAGRTSAVRLRRCMEILTETDMRFKTGGGIPSVLLEEAIVKMART